MYSVLQYRPCIEKPDKLSLSRTITASKGLCYFAHFFFSVLHPTGENTDQITRVGGQ